MKLLVYSDLHLEFHAALDFFRIPDHLEYDCVVLAGDIHKHTRGILWSAETFVGKGIPVYYVAGNHEAYGAHLFGLLAELRRTAKETGVTFLENDEFIDQQNGVRFLGCTLWTDFALYGADSMVHCMQQARNCMPDFSIIRVGAAHSALKTNQFESWHSDTLTPMDTVKIHNRSKAWLAEKLNRKTDLKTVVVTHHLPSFKSVSPRFQKDPVSAAFASRCGDDLVAKADVWIHGHTHDFFDYTISEGPHALGLICLRCVEERGGKLIRMSTTMHPGICTFCGRNTDISTTEDWYLPQKPGKGRVICNPRGYFDLRKDEFENRQFRDDLVIEI